MATTNLDFRKIDYDQLLDKPITRTSANVDTIKTAGVYDRGDGKRFLVSVDGNTITQIEESYNGYRTRTSTDGGLVRGAWTTAEFSDASAKRDVVVISGTEPVEKRETTAWIDTSDENKFKVYDGTDWMVISGQSIQTEEMPTASEELEGKIIQYEGTTTSTFTHGYFYECVGDGGNPEEFSWVNIKVQDAPGQAETMPVPSAENVGQIIQYTGDTNEYHTHGHFYEVIEDPENPGQYIYKEVETQSVSADSVSYDNTDSGLTATNIQEAIDEIAPETIEVDDYSAIQGPCENGFHIPSWQDLIDLNSITSGLNLNNTNDFKAKLHMPLVGFISYTYGTIRGQGTYATYWTYSATTDRRVSNIGFSPDGLTIVDNTYRGFGGSIRAFKNEYVEPDSTWTVVAGTLGGAGVFYNATSGLISLTNGTDKNITMQDKNVGATVVYNDGDSLTEDNMGKLFQWGNNYGFSSTGTIDKTSSTQVDTSGYTPSTYNSDTFIIGNTDWSDPQNDNLWGKITGVQHITIKGYDSQNIVYNNSTSIFNSTNVQDVIDEISDKIENLDDEKTINIGGSEYAVAGPEIAEWLNNGGYNKDEDKFKSKISILTNKRVWILHFAEFNNEQTIFSVYFSSHYSVSNNRNSYTDTGYKNIKYDFTYSNGVYTYSSVNSDYWSQTAYRYLRTDINYSVPYMPTYDGSPATKKYVDEKTKALSKNYTLSSSDGADLKITLPSKNAMYTLTINTDSPTEYNCIVSTTNYSSMGEMGIEIEGLSNSNVKAYYTISSSGNVLYLTNLYASSFDSMSGTISLISNSVTQTEFENIEIAMFDESDLPSDVIEIDLNPSEGGDDHEIVTQAQYDLLTPEQKAAKVYMIKGEGVAPTPGGGSAEDTSYDNTSSGLQADNVQDAIDELAQGGSGTPGLFGYAVPFHNATVKYTQKDNVMGEFYDESNTGQKNALKQYYNADSYLEFSDAISRHYRTGLASNITNITSGKITYGLTTPIFDAETLTNKEYNLDQDGKLVSTRTKENWGNNGYGVMISRFTDPTDNKVKSFSYVSNNSHDITIAVNTWEGDNIISSENKTISGYANYGVDSGSGSVRSYKNIIRVGGSNSGHSNARVCALYVYEGGDFTKIAGGDGYANSMNLIAIDEENGYMYFYYYSGNHSIMSRYDMNNRTYGAYWDRTSGTGSDQSMGGPTVVDVKDGKAVMYYTYGREHNVIREIDLINKTVSDTDKPITYSIREDYKEFYEKMFDEKGGANPTGLSIIETDGVAQLNKIQYSGAMTHTSEIISGECYNIKLNDISLKSEDWYEVLGSEHALYNNAKYGELYAISDKTLSTAGLSINSNITISNLSTDKNYLDIQFDVNQNGTGPSGVYATSIVGMSNSSGDNTRTTFDIVF